MNPPGNAGDTGSIPGLRRSPGEGNGNWFHTGELIKEVKAVKIDEKVEAHGD